MSVAFFRIPAAYLLLFLASSQAHACAGRVHIEVAEDGVYALDQAALVAAQPQLADCASADLVLTQRGAEVPLRISGDAAGRFGAGARIEWLGRALHGPQSWFDPYSTVNVYQLAAAPGAHLRVHDGAVAAAAPAVTLWRTLHLEQENLLLRLNNREMKPGDEPDVWQWAKLTPVDAQPFTLAFDLPDADLAAAAAPATFAFTLDFRGVSNVIAAAGKDKAIDHVVEVAINGKALPSLSWDGRDEVRKRVEVPRALLRASGNRIVLRVPKRTLAGDPTGFVIDAVMFNWLEATYAAHGDLDARGAALHADADGAATVASAQASAALFGSDGSFQRLDLAHGSARAAVVHGVDYFAATNAVQPPLVRAVRGGDLRGAQPGYDYLIVAHPSLLDAIQPLAQLHREQGMHVAVLDVDDVYDAFNGGIAHPAAIRDLVAWGTQHWTNKPHYLLLVGDASTDIHHDPGNGALNGSSYSLSTLPTPAQVLQGGGFVEMSSYSYPQQRRSTRNLVPTWQFPSAEGQSASDNEFVALTPGDFHPTLAVGRFPVVEPAEVEAIVAKTLAYVRKPAPGAWRRDVTFISTSELASFKQASDQFATELDKRGYTTRSIYTDATDRDAGRYQQARSTLRSDLDSGGLLVHFLGHGGSYIWRVGAMGDLFSLDDVSALKNAGRYPLVMAMTCFSAPFDNPSDDSIGERFLREADKGAVAVFAASWKNWPNPAYSRNFIDALLEPGNSIGDAIVSAKAKIPDRDFVEMYNLLGDPALVLSQPRGRLQFDVGAERWNRRVVVRVPTTDFGGSVDVDWLDEHGAVLSSAHYESRDTLFSLPLLAQAATLRAYAVDARNGYAALGAVNLLPPPPPKTLPPRIAAPAAPKAVSAAPAAAAPAPRPARVRAGAAEDIVAQMNFETKPKGRAAAAPGKH